LEVGTPERIRLRLQIPIEAVRQSVGIFNYLSSAVKQDVALQSIIHCPEMG